MSGHFNIRGIFVKYLFSLFSKRIDNSIQIWYIVLHDLNMKIISYPYFMSRMFMLSISNSKTKVPIIQVRYVDGTFIIWFHEHKKKNFWNISRYWLLIRKKWLIYLFKLSKLILLFLPQEHCITIVKIRKWTIILKMSKLRHHL